MSLSRAESSLTSSTYRDVIVAMVTCDTCRMKSEVKTVLFIDQSCLNESTVNRSVLMIERPGEGQSLHRCVTVSSVIKSQAGSL